MAIVGSAYVNIHAVTDKIENQIERAFDKIRDVKINVSADTSAALKKVEEAVDEIEMTKVDLSVDIDDSSLQRAVDEVEENTAHLPVHADTAKARQDLDDLVNDNDGREVTITADPLTSWASARFAWLARARVVEFVAKVNKKAFAQVAATLASISGGQYVVDRLRSINEYLLDIGSHAPKIAGVSLAIAGISGAVSAGISNLLVLGGSLAQISGAALVLPGVFTGMAIGIGTMIVALKDANKYIGDLKTGFTQAADIIKANFWEPAAQPIREFVNGIMPQFQQSIGEVATSLGGFAAATADAFREWLTAPILKYMMDNLRDSIDIAAKGMNPFIESMMTLGMLGSEYLPRLAEWFVRIAENFNEWLQGANSDGRLRDWVEDGISALYDLGGVIVNTSRIFYGLYQAAEEAGGATLGTLAAALGRVADIVNAEPFQTTLIQIFRGGHAAMDGMLSALGPLGQAFQVLGPYIERSLGVAGIAIGEMLKAFSQLTGQVAFGEGLQNMFIGILSGVQGLMPAMGPLGEMLGALGTTIGELARNTGPLFGSVIQTLAPAVQTLLEAVQPLIPVLGDALISIVESLAPTVQSLADAFASSAPAIGGVATVLADIVTAIIDGLGPALPAIIIGVSGIVGAFKAFNGISNVFNGTVSALEKVKKGVDVAGDGIGAFKKAATSVGSVVSSGMSAASSAASSIGTAFTKSAAGAKIAAAATKAWTAVQVAFNAVMSMNPIGLIVTAIALLIAGVVLAYNKIGWFRDLVDGAFAGIQVAIGAVVDFWNNTLLPIFQRGLDAAGDFFNGFGEFFSGIGSAISDGFGAVVDWVSNILTSVATTIADFLAPILAVWTAGWNNIIETFRSIWDGLVYVFKPVFDLIITIVTAFVEIFMAIWNGVWPIVAAIAQGVWETTVNVITTALDAIYNVVTTVVTAVSEWWTTTWQAIVDFFTAVWNNIVMFFTPIIQGIHDTIVTIVTAIVTWWNTTWQSIVDFFTLVWNTMVAVYSPIINSIMTTISSIVSSIQATWNSVWSAISSFFSTIWNGIIAVVTPIINNIRNTISSVLNAISSVWNSVWSSISSFVSNVWNTIANTVGNFVNTVRNKVTEVLNNIGNLGRDIMSRVSNFPSLLVSAGHDLINGLISGINGMKDAVVNKITEIAAGALDAVKNFFGIKSPSRVMRDQVGMQIGAGLAQGIEKSIGRVKTAAEKLSEAAMMEVPDIKLPNIVSGSMSGAGTVPSRIVSDGGDDSGFGPSNFSNGPGTGFSPTVIINPREGMSERQVGKAAIEEIFWAHQSLK